MAGASTAVTLPFPPPEEHSPVLQIRHFRAVKEGSVTLYSVQLETPGGSPNWTVSRRYSEFLRLNVQLLELFGRADLPTFPPKEPLLMKVFRREGTNEWAEERKVRLFQYLSGLLENPSTARSKALLRFVSTPTSVVDGEGLSRIASTTDSPVHTREAFLDPEAEAELDAPDGEMLPGSVRGTEVEPVPGTTAAEAQAAETVRAQDAPTDTADGAPEQVQAGGADDGAPEDRRQQEEDSLELRPPSSPGSEEDSPQTPKQAHGKAKSKLATAKIPKLGLQGAEVHTVFSYQGSAAAAYAKKVAEQRRAATERAPNRFEKTEHGTPRSVAVTFNMVAPSVPEASAVAAQTQHSAQKMGNSLEELQSDQPLRNLRDQEHLVAQWLHAVTGDQQADGVASGQSTLFDVLRSGEVLCDLINAIWPGKIVGIKRGQTLTMSPCSSRRRLTNVTLFVQACRNLGMDQQDMCISSDLEDSKGLRNVMRCIFAIGALVPETEFEGPRLVPWVAKDAFGAVAVPPLPDCQSSIGHADNADTRSRLIEGNSGR